MQIPVGSRYAILENVCPIWTLITSRAYVTSNTIKRHRSGSPANTVPPRTTHSIRCCQTFPSAWSSRITWDTIPLFLTARCVTVCSIWTGKLMWSFCAYRAIVTRRANTSICNVWKWAIVLKTNTNTNFLKKVMQTSRATNSAQNNRSSIYIKRKKQYQMIKWYSNVGGFRTHVTTDWVKPNSQWFKQGIVRV